ncbi:S41 family peptidase [Alkalihalobacillus pseudalcaliphilus]|uniref:S41 family peptidase n=1 Tax=Alkalihalobacillus pseudalcaliphilus TaxID=79884 RepID=UPI0009FC0E3F
MYILTDYECASSGDSFVQICQKSPSTTIVGRYTAGAIDYANCCIQSYDSFDFLYPTTKISAVDDGRGIDGVGVKPDQYIPWEPSMLDEDIHLHTVLDLIEKEKA